MEDEKFKLNKNNYIFIGIVSILTIILIIIGICLYKSFSEPIDSLPVLDVTVGRTSTVAPTTTKVTTTTTTTTTMRPLKSPYYHVDNSKLINNEILAKEKITRDDAIKIVELLYTYANNLFNIADNTLYNTAAVMAFAKDNETDKITENDNNYAELYNFSNDIEKLIVSYMHYSLVDIKYNDIPIFIKENNKYYRLENKGLTSFPIFVSVTLDNFNNSEIKAKVRYYLSDYLSSGATAPVYKSSDIVLRFEKTNWKIYSYNFPLYK